MRFEVVFDIVTEPRRHQFDAYASRTDLTNRTMVVEAGSSQQAERLVESMFGGPMNIRVKYANILY